MMTVSLSDLTEALLSAAKTAGATDADAIAVRGSSVSVDVLGGKLEHAERSESTDIGLRVLIGTRQACVSASDTKLDTIRVMAERAVAMAIEAPEDPTVGLADPGQLAQNWEIASLELVDQTPEPAPAKLEDDAKAAEAAALAVKGISTVQAASAGYGQQALHLSTSNGFSGGYERSSRGLSCVAITGEGAGMERDYYGDSRVFQEDLPDSRYIGETAARRTIERAGARKPRTGTYLVLFDERISSSLIGHLLSAVNGAAIVRGASWARDLLDQQVLPISLSISEDPHRPRTSGSRPFDGEGLRTAKRLIVDRGRLIGWTLDLGTARKLGLQSTASAARGVSSPPFAGA